MKHIAVLFLSCALGYAADFMTGQAARAVIGQPTFTAQNADNPSSTVLGASSGLAFANNTLFVTDANRVQASPIQNRVLIFRNVSGFLPSATADIAQGVRCPVCVGAADTVLGQPNFQTSDVGLSQTGLRTPTAVASDGRIVVVADTDNNRVLIWNSIPQTNGAPADLVLGQPDFKTINPPTVSNKSFRAPQGVWIQGTRLFVADTQNHRVMVWNNIPTSNYQAADYVLGEPSFTSAPSPETVVLPAQANNLFYPVAVSSDGQRLYVTDLGHNRVLVWNSIPTATQQPADVAIGQPDLTSGDSNNSTKACASNGTDSANKPTFPARCAATLSFPRFAISDGQRLFIADGGNDRVLVLKSIPTQSGARADAILGQVDEFGERVFDSTDTFRPDSNIGRSAADTIRTPMSLALDGSGNLFVSDPFDRRVLVFSTGEQDVPVNGITNAASQAVFAIGSVTFAGTIKADDTVTLAVASVNYTYKVLKDDTLAKIIAALADQVNGIGGGTADKNVIARTNSGFSELLLIARASGPDGDLIGYSATTSSGATVTVAAASGFLSGGQNSAEIAPGTLVTIAGTNLSDTTVAGAPDANGFYPTSLGGVEVFFDGIRAPLLYVSPTQINTQVPYEVNDASSVTSFVRTEHSDGTVTNTASVAVPVTFGNPGIFALNGDEPRAAIAFHTSSHAIALVDVGGAIKAGDVATVTLDGKDYNYTVVAADTITSVRDALIGLINADSGARVTAAPGAYFFRIVLTAKLTGSDGNGITVAVKVSTSAMIAVTALSATTCCASMDGTPITTDNPAMPGEVISIYVSGLGLIQPDAAASAAATGLVFNGPADNTLLNPVDDALVGSSTAYVVKASLVPGMVGVYIVQLQISTSLPTNPQTQLFIAQNVFRSNIVTIPVVKP